MKILVGIVGVVGIVFLVVFGGNHLGATSPAKPVEHAGHEALHALLAADIATAKAGDFLVCEDTLFVMKRGRQYKNVLPVTVLGGNATENHHIRGLAKLHCSLVGENDPRYYHMARSYLAGNH